MTDFIWHKSILDGIPRILTTRVPSFRQSEEYIALSEYEKDIPSVVCSAFADYVVRLHKQQIFGLDRDSTGRELRIARELLEFLASSSENTVKNLVQDEIFEAFDETDPEILESIKRKLGHTALSLWESAKKSPPS